MSEPLPLGGILPHEPGMDERTRKEYEQKKPREERVMEHADETEQGGFIPPERGPNAPGADRGGEPPRPVQPPTEPGKHKSHG